MTPTTSRAGPSRTLKGGTMAMSAWKEQLHDELDGLSREQQVAILVQLGWDAQEALGLLERQHVYATEGGDNEDPTGIDPG